MDNKTISDIFVDVYNRFWMKWRDRVPPEDSGEWDVLRAEADAIKESTGTIWFGSGKVHPLQRRKSR